MVVPTPISRQPSNQLHGASPTRGTGDPAMSAIEHYNCLIERSLHHFKAMSADEEALAAFTRSHNFTPDFELLREVGSEAHDGTGIKSPVL